jgi:hypothetical protein
MAFGTILTAFSFFACLISDDFNIKINENTQVALATYIHGIDAHLDNKAEERSRYWSNATNLIEPYSELNWKRRISSYIGYILAFLSIIMYLTSLRAIFNDREKTREDADQAEANKYRFDYQ